MSWTTLTYRNTDFYLGDDIVVTVNPGAQVFQGFLNEIHRDYLVIAGTGYHPVPGFGCGSLAFPLTSIGDVQHA